MHNPPFKPGDLALIINAFYPENIGKIVQLKEFVGDGQVLINGQLQDVKRAWRVSTIDGSHSLFGSFGRCSRAKCPEKWLMPLNNNDDDDDINHHQTINKQKMIEEI